MGGEPEPGKRWRGRLGPLLLALAVPFLAGGCWDRVEIIDRGFIAAAAVDAVPGGYRLTVQLVLPQSLPSPGGGGAGGGGAGGGPSVAVLSATGATLAEAASRMDEQVASRLFWGQTRLLIVGQALARRGIGEVVDFLVRNRESRLRTDLLVARGEAAPLMAVAPPYRDIPADNIYQELRKNLAPRLRAFEAAIRLREAGRGFLMPALAVTRPGPSPASPSTGAERRVTLPANPALDGAGVFVGGKLVGWLDGRLTRGALWLEGLGSGGTITLPYRGRPLSVLVERAQVRRRVLLAGERPSVRVDIEVDDTIQEVHEGELDPGRPELLRQLGESLAREIRGRALAALAATRRMGADVYDFGRLFAGRQPAYWRRVYTRWPQIFRSLPVEIRVRAVVRSPGRLVESLQLPR
ncbi:MAG: Ger(x)C family spore germination protein [Bacillota bacterium]|nr:Ger(x)C family spore germination protein [Bacillota bacterium]